MNHSHTCSQGISELLKVDKKLVCLELELFTHGGMVFLFSTSVMFATVSYIFTYNASFSLHRAKTNNIFVCCFSGILSDIFDVLTQSF